MSDYRPKAIDAFGEVCMNCGATEEIEVHHIDKNTDNNSLENLLTLCFDCHQEIHNGWPKRGAKARQLKVELGVRLPEPVLQQALSESELTDTSPGAVIRSWMEKAERFDEMEVRR